MEVISRKDALALGLRFYFTGEPCKHGHVAKRYVSTYFCKECMDARYAENPDLVKSRTKGNYTQNLEAYKQKKQDYYQKNKAEISEKAKRRYHSNKDKYSEASANWRLKNRAKLKVSKREYAAKNLPLINKHSAQRRAAKRQAVPLWLTKEDNANIRGMYEMAARLSSCLRIKHHVDHIVPLRGKSVCGLHVPWNLQAIPERLNLAKNNKLLLQEPSPLEDQS